LDKDEGVAEARGFTLDLVKEGYAKPATIGGVNHGRSADAQLADANPAE
jgi:hypothetical protein